MKCAPLTREQAYVLLEDILRDVLDCDPVALEDGMPVEAVPGWDSLAEFSVLAAAEIRFGVVIRPAEAEGLSSVGELIDLILQKSPCLP
jgi:acyl carrier protein